MSNLRPSPDKVLPHKFLRGVVEGFYGRPWTHQQRLHLIGKLPRLGLNTYFYAPKDDLKHRALWRHLYDDDELSRFRELADASEKHGVQLIYGLSPGLDIRFADRSDRAAILDRFRQLSELGIQHFALLFDDLPGQLQSSDARDFSSLAAAQCDVCNAAFESLQREGRVGRFLFCPTPYCDLMDRQQLGGAGYLDDVGRFLIRDADVLWTGPEIVSREVVGASLQRLTERLGRAPIIWDNLFANDYDLHRLHCGPYAGRAPDLTTTTGGILLNPNNEYQINFVPLRTFATYLKSASSWNPRDAYLEAITEWCDDFQTAQTPLALDDLVLLGDCFYLPHMEGDTASQMLEIVRQLLAGQRSDSVYQAFRSWNRRIQGIFERLTELRDRDLFHVWSRHAWQLKEELLCIDSMFSGKSGPADDSPESKSAPQRPETFRGGLLTKLERLSDG